MSNYVSYKTHKSFCTATILQGDYRKLNIKSFHEGLPVISLLGSFTHKDEPLAPFLKKLVIPDTVIILEKGLFKKCKNLTYVKLSDTLTNISESLFEQCERLSRVILPSSLDTIHSSAFDRCYSLRTIDFPESLIYIDSCAFRYCPFNNIRFPSNVSYIADEVFSYSTSLEEVLLPENLISIGAHAFGYSRLQTLDIPKTCIFIGYFALSSTEPLTINLSNPKIEIKNQILDYEMFNHDLAFNMNKQHVIFNCQGFSKQEFLSTNKLNFPIETFPKITITGYDVFNFSEIEEKEILTK